MMPEPLFRSLDSAAIADEIFQARRSVCYAAPGVQKEPAEAMAALARRIGPELITVCIDFDERVMRMGFGELSAVKILPHRFARDHDQADRALFFPLQGSGSFLE
jgi:hypothetical protein